MFIAFDISTAIIKTETKQRIDEKIATEADQQTTSVLWNHVADRRTHCRMDGRIDGWMAGGSGLLFDC